MVDIPSAATAIYPNLPSAAPAAERAPPLSRGQDSAAGQPSPDRSAAEAIYGREPPSRIDKAREGIDAGKAKPAAETEAAPAETGEFGLARGPLADKFSGLAREAGLSQASASKMVELHREALTSASTEFWDKTSSDWEKASRSQFGARLDSVVGAVKPLLNDPALTTPGFKALLSTYRLGNHPDVIATLSRWAQAMRRR